MYQMSHKVALLTFPSLLALRKHRNGPVLVHLNWPAWDNKKEHSIWEERRNFPANVLDSHLSNLAAKFQSPPGGRTDSQSVSYSNLGKL